MDFKKIYRFYRYECCWPYAVSFFFVLVIYWLDFVVAKKSDHWGSYLAYAIIFTYYLYILYRYFRGKISIDNPKFFIGFLTFKIIVWGVILALLSVGSIYP